MDNIISPSVKSQRSVIKQQKVKINRDSNFMVRSAICHCASIQGLGNTYNKGNSSI